MVTRKHLNITLYKYFAYPVENYVESVFMWSLMISSQTACANACAVIIIVA